MLPPSPTSAPGTEPVGHGRDVSLRITPISAFSDNYIWLLGRGKRAVVVDPGDAAPVHAALAQSGQSLDAIVVTHHHGDHVGGVASLANAYGAHIYGPANSPFGRIDERLSEGARITLLGEEFSVLAVPGHTLDHIAYWSETLGAIFCGDTLFACGCGRLFEGSAEQMFASLEKIASLPEDTWVYCAHEYTSANIRFALAADPENPDLWRRRDDCANQRLLGQPTVPSTLRLEKATNPFLRSADPSVRATVLSQRPGGNSDAKSIFAALRAWKDVF